MIHLFNTSSIDEMKDIFNRLLYQYSTYDFKSPNIFYLRIMNYLHNLYEDYILMNDKDRRHEKILRGLLDFQYRINTLLIVLLEIFKFR